MQYPDAKDYPDPIVYALRLNDWRKWRNSPEQRYLDTLDECTDN